MPDLVCKGWNIHFRDQVPVPDDQHAVDVQILVLNLLQHVLGEVQRLLALVGA